MRNKGSPRGARSAVLQLRLTARERRSLERAAAAEHLPLGTWLRQLGLREAREASADAAAGREARVRAALEAISEEEARLVRADVLRGREKDWER